MLDEHKSALKDLSGATPVAPPAKGEPVPGRPSPLSPSQYVDGIRAGNRVMLSRAITLIESSRPADRNLADEIIDLCLLAGCDSRRVGITGVPGAGKSSLIEQLGNHLISNYGQKVAVLAVDPSSERSGGSILGDKTRMATLAVSDMAFIRPSPAKGSFGGVAERTREAMLLCEAAGYQNIIVETVGVGQSETAVHNMVDFFLLVTLAGAGDELQGIKRGMMELADLVVVNKADGCNVANVEKTVSETGNALQFFPAAPSGWQPCAIATSSFTGRGIAELWNFVLQHAALTHANGWFEQNRREQRRRWMHEILDTGLRRAFNAQPLTRMRMEALERDVVEGRIAPFRVARMLLDAYVNLGPRRDS